MHILHILDHSLPLQSGYTFRTWSIIQQQRALGWQTNHLTGLKHPVQQSLKETSSGLSFFRTPPPQSFWTKLSFLKQIATITTLITRLEQVAKEIRPDILHAHSPALNGIATWYVSRRLGIPMVYEIRAFWEDAAVSHGTSRAWGIRYRMTRALESFVVKRADAVTVICEGLRQEILSRGISSSKIGIIPNAVDSTRFQPRPPHQDTAKQLGIKDKVVLGFIGSFYAYEGLPILLEALTILLKKRSDVILLLVGGGEEEEKLKKCANNPDLAGKVLFTGRVPHEQVGNYYSLVDIFVYPRLPIRLTELVTPLKPLEAMANDTLVVASDVGGHRELIIHGKTGFLFLPNNPKALAECLLSLLEQRSEWAVIRDQAKKFVINERTWATSIAGYKTIYQNVLTNKNHPTQHNR